MTTIKFFTDDNSTNFSINTDKSKEAIMDFIDDVLIAFSEIGIALNYDY